MTFAVPVKTVIVIKAVKHLKKGDLDIAETRALRILFDFSSGPGSLSEW